MMASTTAQMMGSMKSDIRYRKPSDTAARRPKNVMCCMRANRSIIASFYRTYAKLLRQPRRIVRVIRRVAAQNADDLGKSERNACEDLIVIADNLLRGLPVEFFFREEAGIRCGTDRLDTRWRGKRASRRHDDAQPSLLFIETANLVRGERARGRRCGGCLRGGDSYLCKYLFGCLWWHGLG